MWAIKTGEQFVKVTADGWRAVPTVGDATIYPSSKIADTVRHALGVQGEVIEVEEFII